MPDPSVIDSAVASTRADGDTVGIAVTHGFTLVNGDVLYAFLTRTDDLGTAWISTDWVQPTGLNSAFTTGNDMLSTCLRKVITNAAGEPASYTYVTSGVSGTNQQTACLVQVRDADTTTPEDAIGAVSNVVNDFTPTPDTVTVVTDGALVLVAHFASMNDGVSGKTGGAPSGYSLVDFTEEIFAGSLGSFVEVASLAGVAAGVETPGAFTGTPDDATSDATCFTFAVKPLAVTAAPYPYVAGGYYPTEG